LYMLLEKGILLTYSHTLSTAILFFIVIYDVRQDQCTNPS